MTGISHSGEIRSDIALKNPKDILETIKHLPLNLRFSFIEIINLKSILKCQVMYLPWRRWIDALQPQILNNSIKTQSVWKYDLTRQLSQCEQCLFFTVHTVFLYTPIEKPRVGEQLYNLCNRQKRWFRLYIVVLSSIKHTHTHTCTLEPQAALGAYSDSQ